MRTSLYKQFNASGDLLYVGIAIDPFKRLDTHRQLSNWFSDVTRIDIEWHETRDDALAVEKEIIKRETPTNNRMHSDAKAVEPSEIKRRRLEAGLSQEAAADLLGVTLRTWAYWESGQYKMREQSWRLFEILLKEDK